MRKRDPTIRSYDKIVGTDGNFKSFWFVDAHFMEDASLYGKQQRARGSAAVIRRRWHERHDRIANVEAANTITPNRDLQHSGVDRRDRIGEDTIRRTRVENMLEDGVCRAFGAGKRVEVAKFCSEFIPNGT